MECNADAQPISAPSLSYTTDPSHASRRSARMIRCRQFLKAKLGHRGIPSCEVCYSVACKQGSKSRLGISLILNCGGAHVSNETGYNSVEQEQRTNQPHSSISICGAAVCGIACAFDGDRPGAGQLQQSSAGSGGCAEKSCGAKADRDRGAVDGPAADDTRQQVSETGHRDGRGARRRQRSEQQQFRPAAATGARIGKNRD